MIFFPKFTAPRGNAFFISLVLIGAVCGWAHAGLTVSVPAVAEGNDAMAPSEAVFSLTLSPVSATDTVWEYCTASDTAREGEDYLPVRGAATIPAGQSSATVRVPLIPDSRKEDAETFSLIVWAQGTVPTPALTEIQKPASPANFVWSGPVGVSGGNWSTFHEAGQTGNNNWTVGSTSIVTASGYPLTAISGYGISWMEPIYNAATFRNEYHLGIAERARDGLAPWQAYTKLPLGEISGGTIAMSGDLLAYIHRGYVHLIQLFHHSPPRPVASFDARPNTIPTSRIVGFNGHRVAVSYYSESASEIRIFESTDQTRLNWVLRSTIPDAAEPAAMEGDFLVARQASGGVSADPKVFYKNQGGANQWGHCATINSPANTFGPIAFKGGLLLIGDTWTSPGRILVFSKGATPADWSSNGHFSNPSSAPVVDLFGAALAQGGRDLLALSESSFQNKAWGGSFPGATVTIQNDDLPVLHASAHVGFEPTGSAPSVLRGLVTLTHEAVTPVVVSWTTTAGSAQAGSDYTAGAGQTIIPAGALSAAFEISLLPDDTLETDETIGFQILSVSGAVVGAPPEPFVIRDTDKPSSYIQADSPTAFEATPLVSAQVKVLGANHAVSVTASGILPVMGEPGETAANYGWATPGLDWPGVPQLLTFSTPGTLPLPLPVTNDNTLDYHRPAAIAFTLPQGAASASFSPRLLDQTAGGVPSIPFSEPSSDGTWAVAKKTADQSVLMLYHRSAVSGNWTRLGSMPAGLIGRTSWTGVRVIARGGRLACYDSSAGNAWIIRLNADLSPVWQFEAEIPDLPRGGYYQESLDFDGDTLAVRSLLIERGANDWKIRQLLDDPIFRLHRGVLFCYPSQTTGPFTLRIATRSGPPHLPWQFTGSIPVDLGMSPGNVRRLVVSGNVLAIGIVFNTTTQTQLFRRNDAGEWLFEQTLADYPIALSGSILFGAANTYGEIGPPAAKWQMVGPAIFSGSDLSSDFANGVVVTTSTYSLGFSIWEPGMSFTIRDKEALRFSLPGVSIVEPAAKATLRFINVSVDYAVPVNITIPFQTGTAGTAQPGLDFRPVLGEVVIPAGSTNTSFALPVLPDTLQEGTETIQISLGQPSYGGLNPTSLSSLLNLTDNPLQRPLAPAPVFLPEPAAGSETHFLPFRMEAPSGAPLVVKYSTLARSATSADFTQVTNGSITVPAGSSTIPIPLTILADSVVEGVESLEIEITFLGTMVLNPTAGATVFIDDFAMDGPVPDAFAASQNTILNAAPSRNVLANDSPQAPAAHIGRPTMNGTVALQSDGTFQYTPSANFIGTDRFSYLAASAGSYNLAGAFSWRWLNPLDGVNPGNSVPGFQSNWMLPTFDDSSWQSGSGLLGFGLLGPGAGLPPDTNMGQAPSGFRYTAYLRTAFTVPSTPSAGVTLTFSCDDAVIFYLNGLPLGRYAESPIGTFATAADTYPLLAPTAHDLWEETEIRRMSFPSAQLQSGINILAVSVHNTTNTSSDLGFNLHRLTAGDVSKPSYVTITVMDSARPPILSPDSYSVTGTDVPVSSYLIGGSLYLNDGLQSPAGTAYDPILAAETAGSPVGPVTMDPATGQFTLTPPRGFFGTTGFTYRVRDKDGWSEAVPVTINIAPSRPWDVWRASRISADWQSPLTDAGADLDGDGLPNALEFLLDREPQAAEFTPPMDFRWNGTSWETVFMIRGFRRTEFLLQLESSSSLASPSWEEIAAIPPSTSERLTAPATLAIDYVGLFTRYTIAWPKGTENSRFVRLKASHPTGVLNP